jgi:hypothetical protein
MATLIPTRKNGVTAFTEHARKLRHDLEAAKAERQRITDALVVAMWSADPSAPRQIKELTAEQGIVETTIANLERALASADDLRRAGAATAATAEYDRLAIERAKIAAELRKTWSTLEDQVAAVLATNARLHALEDADREAMNGQRAAVAEGGLKRDVAPAPAGLALNFGRNDLPGELASASLAFAISMRGR